MHPSDVCQKRAAFFSMIASDGSIYARCIPLPLRMWDDKYKMKRITKPLLGLLFCGIVHVQKLSGKSLENREAIQLRRDAFEVRRGTLTCTASVQNCASPARSPLSCTGRLQAAVHQVRDLARPGARRCFRKVNPPPVELTCRPSPCTASACP